MHNNHKISVIIPAFNEEGSIPKVIKEIPVFVDEIIVVDNGSFDNTFTAAEKSGAITLSEQTKGYGAACLKGIEYVKSKSTGTDEIIVFLDADYSDYPNEMNLLVEPIVDDNYDFVIGSRMIKRKEHRALLPQAIIGNWIASVLISMFWKCKYTDLGPFRAIRLSSLLQLNMDDKNFGWTAEMQIKAAKQKLKIKEIPVNYRKRMGKSKVTGTFGGTVKASAKILFIIFSYKLKEILR